MPEVSRGNFLESLPAVIAQSPHVFDQLLAIGLFLKGLCVPRMFRNGLGIVHGKVRLRDQRRAVRPPEVGPQEEGLFAGGHLVEHAKGFLGDEILDAGLDRPLV